MLVFQGAATLVGEVGELPHNQVDDALVLLALWRRRLVAIKRVGLPVAKIQVRLGDDQAGEELRPDVVQDVTQLQWPELLE